MKKIIRVLNIAYCIVGISLAAEISFAAEEKKENVFDRIVKTAMSPVETVIGPVTGLGKIVITPSRMEESQKSSSVSVSVIDRQDFNNRKVYVVKDAIKSEQGVDIAQAGAFQGQTSLFVRGGNSNHTLVLIDGVKAYDPISPNGAYNIAHLTLDNVETIELLRGPQSALYGTDAMSGVLSVISRKAEKPYVEAAFDAGSFYTYNELFSVGSRDRGFSYTMSGSRLDTKGISQAQAKKNNQERDPYDRTALALRADYDFTKSASIGATWRYTKSHYNLDQGADADDDNASEIDKENFLTLFADVAVFDWWKNSARLGWMELIRLNYDDDSPFTFDFTRSKYYGRNFTFDYHSNFAILGLDNIIIGYAYNEECADSYSQNDYNGYMEVTDMPKVFDREGDFYLENRLNLEDRLTSTQGMRVSHHSIVGTHVTYRLDGSYLFATGTKLRGLVATGFKAPSLYQLFAPPDLYFGGGNTDLKPEKSFSYEYGLDQYLFGDKFTAGLTYFHTLYTNLIDSLYNPMTWTSDKYINIGKAQVHGVECSSEMSPAKNLKVKVGLTYQKTKDFQNDQQMPRRPDLKMYTEIFWQITEKLNVDIAIKYVGPRSDNYSNPSWGLNTYKDKQYVVVNMAANYDATKNFSIFAKMDNLFNKYYEDIRGYTTEPFRAFGGVKAKF